MTVRELAKNKGFKIVGSLRRIEDARFGMGNGRYPVYVDEAGNKYLMGNNGVTAGCIVTPNGNLL